MGGRGNPIARTGQQEASNAQAQYFKNANQSYQGEQADIGAFNKNTATLQRGGEVGANPWLSPAYLATQNKLTANAVSGENDAATKALRDENLRSGGLNTTATNAGIRDMALRKMRTNDVLNAQRTAGDFNKNVQYQQSLARAPLEGAAAEQGAYGTSTGGEGASLDQLASFGRASYGPWQDLLSGGLGAAGGILKGFTPHG